MGVVAGSSPVKGNRRRCRDTHGGLGSFGEGQANDCGKTLCREKANPGEYATVAQFVEQLLCNQQVGGSSPSSSSNTRP